ncbi:dihydroorotase [Rhizobium leguminosarum bv. trifolii CB782]|uniref:dihydroorotase n=1 Tax=Rhizobium hidalgonense TaxID=1538159 RepID=UPI00027D3D50|nr:dihydroorotase [Rhizobium hidalgonense]AHG44937.1 dihydroorotase [Rhizobium leguminosarum bv. trifolii CB782]EJC73075.1 dihydroorotase, multifunctional complex type [Rhizobium leguminosarum bv. trifolii WSM2012]MDR9806468.1 dihydroorotase [Rhizobium hidalgonense]QKK24178.1 dihydroorotase [Rhizobium hidalgonense]
MSNPIVLQNVRIVDPSRNLDEVGTIIAENGVIVAAGHAVQNQGAPAGAVIRDCTGLVATPGLVDARVHIGEPGGEHRETIASASRAAAAGGVTSIIMMPDTDPVIDDIALVEFVKKTARDTAAVNVYPAAAITKGLAGEEMTEIGLLMQAGAVAFTDAHSSVHDTQVLRRIMTYAREFGAVISCETRDKYLGANGVMHEGLFASWLGLSGIPREAELIPLERDLRIAELTRGHYHAAMISVPQSVEAIERARSRGAKVTAGISINNLALNENDIGEYRTFFKLYPPLRPEDDRVAMVEALASGAIDIIVSSHDPQDVDTKRLPFGEAEDGAVGLETMLAAALRLHHGGQVSLMRLIDAMSTRPAEIFGLAAGTLKPGAAADIALIDLDEPWLVAKDMLLSRSKNTPFEDARFSGRAVATYVSGKLVHAL